MLKKVYYFVYECQTHSWENFSKSNSVSVFDIKLINSGCAGVEVNTFYSWKPHAVKTTHI